MHKTYVLSSVSAKAVQRKLCQQVELWTAKEQQNHLHVGKKGSFEQLFD